VVTGETGGVFETLLTWVTAKSSRTLVSTSVFSVVLLEGGGGPRRSTPFSIRALGLMGSSAGDRVDDGRGGGAITGRGGMGVDDTRRLWTATNCSRGSTGVFLTFKGLRGEVGL